MKRIIYMAIAATLSLTACQNNSNKTANKTSASETKALSEQVNITYAQGFRVKYQNHTCLLDIQDPQKEKSTAYHFALIPKGESSDGIPEGYTPVEVPVGQVICMTSLQLSNFIKLDALDHVCGITSTRHLFNAEVKRRIKEGQIRQIGIEGNFDNEVIMGIRPDLILISPFKRGGYETLKEVDIPLIPHLGYKEMTPLGQAEWIKFVALLTGQEKEANALFATIEQRYNSLKALTAGIEKRPTVFSGEMRGGNWYAVGGKSFLAQLFQDAGADYFLKDDENSGGVTLDYETVYSEAAETDYWRIVNSHKGKFTYDALREEDARYADFKAFKEKGVIYCNMSEKPFYESMPTEPEKVLADLIKVFHPSLLPDYDPTYYERLK